MAFQAQGREHQLFAIRGFVFTSTPQLVCGSGPPPPAPFHVSAPVSSFASCSVCGFSERGQGRGTSAAGMADPAPVLTAPWLVAGGELAGVRRTELPALGGLWPALLLEGFALIWGDGSDRAAAPVLGRPCLGVLRAKCRRAEATLVPAGTGRQPEGEVPRIAHPTGAEGLSQGQHPQQGMPPPTSISLAPSPCPAAGTAHRPDRRTWHCLPWCLQRLAGPQPRGTQKPWR